MSISSYIKRLRDKVGTELIQMPCVGAVIKEHGRILLQRRKDDRHWGLPGGAIDPGESPAQALLREVYEEVGLRVQPVRLIGVFGAFPLFRHVYPNGDQVHVVVSIFSCEVIGGSLSCRDGEATELRYFDAAHVPTLLSKYPSELFAEDRREAYFEWQDEWA